MKKPTNRKERIEWIGKKLGRKVLISYASSTDKEVKREFELLYNAYKDKPDYDPKEESNPECVVCGHEVEIIYSCNCKAGCILDKNDPDYEKYKKLYENGGWK